MRKYFVRRMFCAAAAVLLLAGCASGSETGNTQSPEAAVTGAASDTDSANDGANRGAVSDVDTSDVNTIVIYSPHDADPLNAVIVNFMAKYPKIKVELIPGGTGELCSKIAEEAENPEADVLWGGGADSLEAYKDYFEAYTSVNSTAIDPRFNDAGGIWSGESPLPMVIIYNKKLLSEAGVTAPASWNDCLKPEFKGQIAYCLPSKSGSAYTQLCTMLFAHGGIDAGWSYVSEFAANLNGKILDSSSKCHKLVASGEYMIGITIEKSAILYADNPDIGFCYPADGTSAVPDAIAIVKNCPHEANARLFTDFVTSYECQKEQSDDWSRRPSRTDLEAPAGLASMSDINLVNYDFSQAALRKEEIIEKFEAMINK